MDDGAVVKTGARIGPYSVIGRQCHVEEHAASSGAIIWSNTRVGQEAIVRRRSSAAIATSAGTPRVEDGVVLGDKSVVTDYSRL